MAQRISRKSQIAYGLTIYPEDIAFAATIGREATKFNPMLDSSCFNYYTRSNIAFAVTKGLDRNPLPLHHL